MALDGRINVDVLFHDTDGTTSLKVVSLEDATSYTTGKVAVVSGTAGTSEVSIAYSSLGYKNASGDPVAFSLVRRVAIKASRDFFLQETAGAPGVSVKQNEVSLLSIGGGTGIELQPEYTSGTAAYTIVIYGT